MPLFLTELKKKNGVNRKSKRVGRGFGTGKGGHTTGAGNKGQKSRSGGKVKIWFEGGQTPLIKRLPYKRGFRNPNPAKVISINLSDLEVLLKKETNITPELVDKAGIVELELNYSIKILSRGNVPEKVHFKGFLYSKTTKEKIEKAGGKAE